MKHTLNWLLNRRALSPIFATLILVAVVVVFGTATYLYASNVTTSASNQLTGQMASSQQEIAERVSVESVYYHVDGQSNHTLTVFILNNGISNGVKVNAVLLNILNGNQITKTYPYNISPFDHSSINDLSMKRLNGDDSGIRPLNVGEEGYFVIRLDPLAAALTPGGYSIELITQSGSSFVYAP